MKLFLSAFFIMLTFISCRDEPVPVAIIFDTDIAPDYDDVGALAMLHAFANNGEAKILATISSNAFKTTAPTLSVINTYFNRATIPVGVIKASEPNFDCPRLWAQKIIADYPHAVKANDDAWDALKLYRKILSEQPDKSVTIVTVGTFTNLSNLLTSQPDEYSSLNGKQLIAKKVVQLVSMATAIDSTGNSGYESNVIGDIPAAQNVIINWPSSVTITPFEIGAKIFTGMRLINNTIIQNSPVKDAYYISINYDGTKDGRYSWDQTAVLVSVRGIAPYFKDRKLNLTIKNDGKDSVMAGNRITYLVPRQKPEEISRIIEELMMQQPAF